MAKVKNPFKKNSAIDTAINVGIGGAANVAIDFAINKIDEESEWDSMYVNAGKFIGGVVLGSMIPSNRYLRAACDGIATVGVSNLVASLMEGEDENASSNEGAQGLPFGTIGRIEPGHTRYAAAVKRSRKVSGASQFIE